jgi:segregation and condensation protein A
VTETVETTRFRVETPVFSGPFRLLANLILDQKVDVSDVSLATVTASFLRLGTEQVEAWTLEEVTWFLAVCASLLELKVGRLLPRSSPDTEEELLAGYSPDLLYARSLELTALRSVGVELARLMAEAALSMPRTVGAPAEFAHLYPDVMAHVSAESLRSAAAVALAPPPYIDLSHVAPIRATLADALVTIRGRLRRDGPTRFRDLIQDCQERIEVVVRFLAVLELHREGEVELSQANVFGDIQVQWQRESSPHPESETG